MHPDNTATIYSVRVNLGQGSPNGLLMIAGEELDLAMSQLDWVDADSNVTPDSGVTVGRSSLPTAGPAGGCGSRAGQAVAADDGRGEPRRPGREPVREGRRRIGRRTNGDLRRAD